MTTNIKLIKLMLLVVATFAAFSFGAYAKSQWSALSAMVYTPPEWSDRNESERDRIARMRPISDAIESVSSGVQDSAALLALAHVESKFASRIQNDKCRPSECDAGMALGIWQLQRTACPSAWKLKPGPERLKVEAECALRVYHHYLDACKGKNPKRVTDGLSGYRGKCVTTDGTLRTRAYEAYVSILSEGWPQPPSGWKRAQNPTRSARKTINAMMRRGEVSAGQIVDLGNGEGALGEWHWHDPSGPKRPKGWHIGFSLFEY